MLEYKTYISTFLRWSTQNIKGYCCLEGDYLNFKLLKSTNTYWFDNLSSTTGLAVFRTSFLANFNDQNKLQILKCPLSGQLCPRRDVKGNWHATSRGKAQTPTTRTHSRNFKEKHAFITKKNRLIFKDGVWKTRLSVYSTFR